MLSLSPWERKGGAQRRKGEGSVVHAALPFALSVSIVAATRESAIQIAHHVAVGEPNHAIAFGFDYRRSRGVAVFSFGVRIAINFDH